MIVANVKTRNILILLPIFLVYVASLSVIEADQNTLNTKKRNVGIWSLPPVVLSALAGEFRGMTANWLILEAGARLGTRVERTPEGKNIAVPADYDCGTIYTILSASQHLDPAFAQTFIVANGWLPWDCGMVRETMEILQTAAENRPWDWLPSQIMAFNTYYFLNDNGKAGKILLEASKKLDNPPPYFAILGARLAKKGGETASAIIFLKDILRNKGTDEPGYKNIVRRLHALEAVLVIEQAVKQYREEFDTLPETTEQLLKTKNLQALPDNPYKLPYCIDQVGAVFFDRPDCRTKRQ